MTPKETLGFINKLMAPMIPVIHAHEGFINQFIGDAIMAIFYGAQKGDADSALAAGIELQGLIDQANHEGKKGS